MHTDTVRKALELLGVSAEEAEELKKRRLIRIMEYRDLTYIVVTRDARGLTQGTIAVAGRTEARLVPGYPPITRVLLPSIALPKHFIDKVVVEEKMNGYNVRVFELEGNLYAATRGGYICPYTTHRIRRMQGEKLRKLIESLGPETTLFGEVVGLENPYTRYYYPEAPSFGYFIFDIHTEEGFMPPQKRIEFVENHGIPHVPVHGIIDKNDAKSLRRIMEKLEKQGREGVVLKDPQGRVPPLKYTTSRTNTSDLELGMKFFFEEGRSFLFSRILRQVFMAYEEDWNKQRLEEEAKRLGRAILLPAVQAIRDVAEGKGLYEEYTLRFGDEKEMIEFEEHMASLGVVVARGEVRRQDNEILVTYKKFKDTATSIASILRTGLSPLD